MPSPTPLNYAEQYQSALLQQFPHAMYFGALFATPNNSLYRPVNARVIEIPSISTTGRVDGDRDTIGAATRNYDNEWTPLRLMNHRKWKTTVHPHDIDQTNMVATITNITRVYNQEQKIPEMQAYLTSKLYADFLEFGGTPITDTLTVDNILYEIDDMMSDMDEALIPREGRILYVTSKKYDCVINAKQIYRHVDLKTTETRIRRAVTAIDELEIVRVPSDLMKTLYDFTVGWRVAAGAAQINMIMVHPLAVLTPIHYEFVQLDPPSAGSDGKYIYFEESFEDVFLLERRKKAIAFNVEATESAPTYTAVTDPTGNPAESGWYELVEGAYVLTSDTSVTEGKTYYASV